MNSPATTFLNNTVLSDLEATVKFHTFSSSQRRKLTRAEKKEGRKRWSEYKKWERKNRRIFGKYSCCDYCGH